MSHCRRHHLHDARGYHYSIGGAVGLLKHLIDISSRWQLQNTEKALYFTFSYNASPRCSLHNNALAGSSFTSFPFFQLSSPSTRSIALPPIYPSMDQTLSRLSLLLPSSYVHTHYSTMPNRSSSSSSSAAAGSASTCISSAGAEWNFTM